MATPAPVFVENNIIQVQIVGVSHIVRRRCFYRPQKWK